MSGPHERFQERFVPLLTEAREVAHVLASDVGDHFPSGVPGDAFPMATSHRLLVAVLPLYHAAVGALGEPETTIGALALLRCLIEAWMQLYFVMGTDDQADAACRAIRLEAGWAVATVGMVRAGGGELANQLAVAERRQVEIEALQSKRGCKGGRRDYGDVGATVRTMAAQYGIDWLPGAWHSASQVTHVSGWDWLMEAQGDGTLAVVYPAPSHRAARLNHLVVLFYNVAQTALVVLGVDLDSDPARSVHKNAMRVLDNRFLKRAIEGDYD